MAVFVIFIGRVDAAEFWFLLMPIKFSSDASAGRTCLAASNCSSAGIVFSLLKERYARFATNRPCPKATEDSRSGAQHEYGGDSLLYRF